MTAIGGSFGKYFLTEKIATGGMAEIYLAKLFGPGGFEKQLVLKQIHPELSGRQQFVELFVAEAKTLVTLTHGNLVPVYELGVVDGTYFIAMEYIDGPTLGNLLRALGEQGEVMSPGMAIYITSELLKGLDYAHRKGESVIHRDVSPRNVMISREGEVKLLDFGIAVTVDSQADKSGSKGTPAGSFPYMSPEQVRREPLDGQTDIFSAGILLWEMLTGESLFARDDAEETLAAVETADIPLPSTLRSSVPEQLDQICARALARSKEDRYPTAGAFLADVNRYLYSLDVPVSPEALSRLVAANCPPVSRPSADLAFVETASVDEPGIDATAPMAGRQGKPRASTKTFATHAEFEDIILKGTPLVPFSAITDEDLVAADSTAKSTRRADDEPKRPVADADGATDRPNQDPTRRPTAAAARPSLLLQALTLVALFCGGAFASWLVFRAPTVSPDAVGPSLDAAAEIADAAVLDGSPVDAPSVDAAIVDATPIDARPRKTTARIDARPVPRGTGTLVVGAKPWGVVYVAGKKLGQAPGAWPIAAGRHQVEVRYPVAGKEQSKSFTVEVTDQQRVQVGPVLFTTE